MGAIAPLALVGLVLALGTGARPTNVAPMAPRSRLLPMLAFLLVPVLSMSLFYVGARFRLELAAMLLPLAGLAIVRLGRLLRERRFSVLLAVAAGVVVLGVALHRPDGEIVRQRRMRLIQLHTFLAERAASRDVARAELRLATEAAVYPAEAEGAWRALGLLARESGDAEAAERAAGIASGVLDDATFSRLAGMRDDADAQWAVGRHLMLRGEKARAAEVLEEAARLSPDDPDVLLARAIAAMEAGTSPPDRVARWVEEAFDAGLRFSPNAATGHLLAARCYERLGDGGKAEAAAQEARRYLSDTSRSASRPG
jgi:tetratricopeptide (TPR) repeat protein